MSKIKEVLGIKPETEEAPKKPVLKTVRNVTNMPQIIGRVEIEPGKTAKLDVSEGSMGAKLVATGVLVDVAAQKKAAKEQPALVTTQPIIPIHVGHYQCPWCDHVTNEAEVAKRHVITSHATELLMAIAVNIAST